MRYAGDMPLGRTHQQQLDAHTRNPWERYPTAKYCVSPFMADKPTGVYALVTNRIYGIPFPVTRKMTADRIFCDVQTAQADKNARLGIYKDNGNHHPGALVLDAGEVSLATTGIKEITISQQMEKGLHWLAIHANSTSAQIYWYVYMTLLGLYVATGVTRGMMGYTQGSYGALPDPLPSTSLNENGLMAVGLRFSSMD